MECPQCRQNHEKSMCFPANNLKLSEKIPGFYDNEGVFIELKQIPLQYACVNGHVFKLHNTKIAINGQQTMPTL
jgi:hypothetical protein